MIPQNFSSMSAKSLMNAIGILIGITLSPHNALGRMIILAMLILLGHGPEVFFHFLISISFFFSSLWLLGPLISIHVTSVDVDVLSMV